MAMLALGARAQAASAPACAHPGPLDAPGVTGWAGPSSLDGALDDGFVPTFSGDIFAAVGVSAQGLPTPFSYTSVAAPYTDLTGCMGFDAQGHMAAHSCLCMACLSTMAQCDAMPGCRAIWKCAEDSGCTNAQACYLLPGAPCTNVINLWGTGSVSTALSQALQSCGAGASPACPTM